ncbi:MAG: hypothetical protein AAFO07_00075 [Bacteroidota bacterium]
MRATITQPSLFTEEPILLDYSLLNELIKELMPELLDGSKKSKRLLKRIEIFLFFDSSYTSELLANELRSELYNAFRGIKSINVVKNINLIEWYLEEKKREFGQWLDQAIQSKR